ncbi:LacI family DNA-binding transcriptional regulator [uncultured Friedmanniella sp.]|uniref:LacI family DNA-binding transcriptional regulator n=1 Tax=uncultured Friedmanniella sp. TaxID=335381 RepID=UPI0035C9E643
MTPKISIVEVAADAGVSVTTVSHALSGKRAVSNATRAKVLASIERLNYRPSMLAQGLRNQQTRTVGLLIADITNPYYPAVARAVHDGLTAHRYLPLIGNTDGDPDVESSFLHEMLARSVDGIIMQPMALCATEIYDIVGPSTALVMTGNDAGDPRVDTVTSDDGVGITEAVGHLHGRGYRRIGFVSGPEHLGPGDSRLAAFRTAMAGSGLTVEERWIRRAAYTRDGGEHTCARWFAEDDVPEAIVCANDLIAIGAMDAARAAGLVVPQDVAIVGFDDIETADLVTPRLTTVINPATAVGAACAAALLARMQSDHDLPAVRHALPTRLVVRESA